MSTGRILIVDDDPHIRRVMRTALVAQGYEVGDARTAEEAIEKIRGENQDLVLLDVNLPGIGGLEACRVIRRMRGSADAAIIMLTVRDSERDKVEALDAGADDYVTKPFGTPELLARIRAALRRLPLALENAPQAIRLDENVTVDFQSHQVRARGREMRLTPKECQLLRYLVAHPNRTIPHRELLQAVWGADYGDELEYLRVFVNQLRKKIEANPARPKYLLTDPWAGYRFHPPE